MTVLGALVLCERIADNCCHGISSDELPQVEDRIRSLSPTLAGKLRQPLQQVKQVSETSYPCTLAF